MLTRPNDAVVLGRHTAANNLAWILNFYDKDFAWDYASIQQAVYRCISQSPCITDSPGHCLPGSMSATTLSRRLQHHAKRVLARCVNVDPTSTQWYAADNCPHASGKYQRGSGRSGMDSKGRRPAIVCTAVCVQHFIGKDNECSIQKAWKVEPKGDKPLSKLTAKERRFNELTTSFIDGEAYSEQGVLELEIVGFLQERLPHAQKALKVQQVVAPIAAIKACPRCSLEVSLLTRYCK
ncbi:hypothetical protein B484DRAFT_471099 [Ochromonadaceae sp. CCMP2298]|nr:hypothetical protein B484DRAFT_471099 [Ochromonadaceae sp. CCMP2298]